MQNVICLLGNNLNFCIIWLEKHTLTKNLINEIIILFAIKGVFRLTAEKEIVNYWLNKKGFFTISNIKVARNKDVGILALKFDKEKLNELLHIEVSCSISSSITETIDIKKTVDKIAGINFLNQSVSKAVDAHLQQFQNIKKIKRILVLGALPKSRKKEIIESFNAKGITVVEFEEIACEVIKELDMQYYKNDVIRTLQLVKHLLLTNPKKLADLLSEKGKILNVNTRGIFLNELLNQELMRKEFTRADENQLISILKYSSLKSPEKLAALLEKEILNRKTRKPFMNFLLEQEKMKKLYKETTKSKENSEKSLVEFFK